MPTIKDEPGYIRRQRAKGIDWNKSTWLSPFENAQLCPLCSITNQRDCPHEQA